MSDSDSDLFNTPNTKNVSATSIDDSLTEHHDPRSSIHAADDEDVDAVGSDDADFEVEYPPVFDRRGSDAKTSSSQSSTSGTKRKALFDEDEDIRNNPDLYGLRRSGRAKLPRQAMRDSSDSDSDVDSRPAKRRKAPAPRSSKPVSPELMSSSESESESEEEYAVSKRSKKRSTKSETSAAPSYAEVRFSTRRAAGRVSNYAEDDDDDDLLDDEDIEMAATPQYYTVPDETPAIDVVLNHRLKEDSDASLGLDLTRTDFEYYIKWQNKAHYHSTWESFEYLQQCRSFRRLENYLRKIWIEDLHIQHAYDVTPEEREKWNLDRERDIDALEEHKKVERVIGSRDGDEGLEYLIKWKGLFYEFCTWEDAELISEIAQDEVDRFLDRRSRNMASTKSESNLATRREHKPLREQPSYIKHGKLRDFQLRGLNFLAHNWAKGSNVILADEMGLGKTVQTVSFMSWLRHDRGQQGPFLVVVPLSTIPAWAETFDLWAPDINYVIYNGKEASRKIIKEYELLEGNNPKNVRFNCLLTTYEFCNSEATFLGQIKWQFMAVDEAHRLKNRESQLYSKLLQLKVPSRLLITGTPVQNNLGELSALMDFLMPGEVDMDIDLNAEEASEMIAKLNARIRPHMLRRTKEQVENDLPPKSEKIIRVELADVQLEYYKNILTKNYAALNPGFTGPKQSLLNIVMELKKTCNHPFLLANGEESILHGSTDRGEVLRKLITSSGKMMVLDLLLDRLKKEGGHRVLIFCQMVKMLDILGDYMAYRGYAFQRLDGTIATGPRRMAIDHFNAPGSADFCFLLSTRAGGLGINLMTADTVILFDSDWNPQADLQAMARAHRIGQTKPVSVYRLVSKETVEEEVLERARLKLMLEWITIRKGITDPKLSEKAQKAQHDLAQEPNSTDDIQRILKRRGQKMFEQSGNQKKLEELDIDSVLENAEELKTEQAAGLEADGGEDFLRTFDYVNVKVTEDELPWEKIIPQERLDQIKADDEAKKHQEFLNKAIEDAAPRKRRAAAAPVDNRAERKAKRQARAQVSEEQESDSESDDGPDPKRPLQEKEYRHLVRAFLRYGDFEDCPEEIITEARLKDRDIEVVKAALKEITDRASDELSKSYQHWQDLEKAGKVFTKKEKKAVLFDHRGVKRLNAETLVERPAEMRMLREIVASTADPKAFRVPEATKLTDYSCPWGARDDGMLCVGVARHGYGAWMQIRDDPDLGLQDKLFLEEHQVARKEERAKTGAKADGKAGAKSPGAVHLVRRADYLLSVLKDKTSNGTNTAARKNLENHHRNTKRTAGGDGKRNGIPRVSRGGKTSASASPAPGHPTKGRQHHREHARPSSNDVYSQRRPDSVEPHHSHTPKAERHDSRTDRDLRHDIHRKERRDSEDPHRRHHSSKDHHIRDHDDLDSGSRQFFKPIKSTFRELEKIKHNKPAKSEVDDSQRLNDKKKEVAILSEHLKVIGNFVKEQLKDQPSKTRAELEKRFW